MVLKWNIGLNWVIMQLKFSVPLRFNERNYHKCPVCSKEIQMSYFREVLSGHTQNYGNHWVKCVFLH